MISSKVGSNQVKMHVNFSPLYTQRPQINKNVLLQSVDEMLVVLAGRVQVTFINRVKGSVTIASMAKWVVQGLIQWANASLKALLTTLPAALGAAGIRVTCMGCPSKNRLLYSAMACEA